MSATTGISWTDRTWNPVVGCTKVSQGCKHCYAKTLHDQRHKAFAEGKLQNIPQYRHPFESVQTLPGRLTDPLGWRTPARVFVNSMSDLFHDDVPDAFIDQVFAVMVRAHRHTFQILTKRPERMRAFVGAPSRAETVNRVVASMEGWHFTDGQQTFGWPRKNIWLGVSVENQAAADERIPLLLKTPAAIRFLSCEPLLGPVDVAPYVRTIGGILCCPRCGFRTNGFSRCPNENAELVRDIAVDWVIAGGESGKGARPMHPDWAKSLRDQCSAAGVPFHFKQWGDWAPSRRIEHVGTARMDRVGTKRAGRELDGRVWDEFPAVHS